MSRDRRIPPGTRLDRDFARAVGGWQALVMGLDTIDPLTTEVVRLRAAQHHDCHT